MTSVETNTYYILKSVAENFGTQRVRCVIYAKEEAKDESWELSVPL
jgi:hypothetical protein